MNKYVSALVGIGITVVFLVVLYFVINNVLMGDSKKAMNNVVTSTITTTTEEETTTSTTSTTTTTKKTTTAKTTAKKTTTKKVTTTTEPLDPKVASLKMVAVGDSVMLGAEKEMKARWSNLYFDAKVSRGMKAGVNILADLKKNNKLGTPVVVHLGTNGGCSEANLNKIMEIAEDRPVFMLTTTNPKILKINTQIKTVCGNYSNCHVVDWYTYLNEWREDNADNLKNGWKDLTYKDGMHLRPEKGKNTKTGEKQPYSGRYLYAKLIYDNISKYS